MPLNRSQMPYQTCHNFSHPLQEQFLKENKNLPYQQTLDFFLERPNKSRSSLNVHGTPDDRTV